MSVLKNKAGIGVQIIQDKLGDVKNTEFQTAYSYKIDINHSVLSFGMQTGFTRFTNDPSALTIRNPGDPAFNYFSETKFNVGAGLFLKGDRYVLGLSAPRLLPARISQGGGQSIEVYHQH